MPTVKRCPLLKVNTQGQNRVCCLGDEPDKLANGTYQPPLDDGANTADSGLLRGVGAELELHLFRGDSPLGRKIRVESSSADNECL